MTQESKIFSSSSQIINVLNEVEIYPVKCFLKFRSYYNNEMCWVGSKTYNIINDKISSSHYHLNGPCHH